MAELQQILARRRSSADQHVFQVSFPVGGRKSRQEQEGLAFRSGWSSTPGCAGRNSFDISTPRGSFTTIGDDNNLEVALGYDNVSDAESEGDLVKSGDLVVLNLQQTLTVTIAERNAATLDAANARGELAKAQEEIAQLRESLSRMNSSTAVLLGALQDQQLKLAKEELSVVEAPAAEDSPFITAAFGVFDLLDLDQDGLLSLDDVQVFAELMTPPKDKEGPEVLCQKIGQQLGMTEFASVGRPEWLQLIQARAADSALGKQLTIVDLERLISSLEALEAAGMRRY